MKNKVVLIVVFWILCSYIRAFAETTIMAEVDKLKITADDTITYKLVITSTEKNIPQPVVADFTGFIVVSQAQSSTISFIKSGIKSILVYAYILEPQGAGKFKIKPSRIKVKNEVISSQEFEINVTQGKSKSWPKSEEKPSLQPQITL